jgi:hypothetical protein
MGLCGHAGSRLWILTDEPRIAHAKAQRSENIFLATDINQMHADDVPVNICVHLIFICGNKSVFAAFA